MLDSKKLLAAIDVVTVLEEAGIELHGTDGGTYKILCPFHEDKDPSCVVLPEVKRFKCYSGSCGKQGDIITLVAKAAGSTRQIVAEYLAREVGLGSVTTGLDVGKVEAWAAHLQKTPTILEMLKVRKAITKQTAKRFLLGLDRGKVTIPVFDINGDLVNVRRFNPAPNARSKYQSVRGCAQARLYPIKQLKKHDTLVIAEGEFKALCLIERGIPAIASTAGASTWLPQWGPAFKDKRVAFVYDIDEAGKKGALKAARLLSRYTKEIRIARLPLDEAVHPHGGIDDFFLAGGTVQELKEVLEQTPPYLTEKAPRESVPHGPAIKLHLADSTKAVHHRRLVACRAVVSAKDTAPYLTPAKVRVGCSRDQNCCALCPIFDLPIEDSVIEIPENSEATLKLVNVTTKQLDIELRHAIGIPNPCKVAVLRTEEARNVEEVRLVPQLSVAHDHKDPHAVIRAFYVGAGLDTNVAYEVEGTPLATPQTQHATLLVTHAKPNVDDLSTFELEPDLEERLKLFRPEEWTTPTIEAKLDELYDDLSANVTRIYGRPLLHKVYDLIWHSALYLRFQGRLVKGWLEGLVIGDPGQGKSEVAEALRKHYGLGERIEVKGASAAGLIGGLQETQRRWWISWGVIPLNDRRLVVMDEIKGLPTSAIAKLTDLRSSGVAEIVKIERRKTYARTRLVWISNPRSERPLATYSFGVEAVRELIGALEDIRRFDIAMAVASGEVNLSTINATMSSRPKVPHKHTAELCRALVLWSWSRTVDQISFEPGTEETILAGAQRLSEAYSSGIPLVEPADQRFKIARLATSLAARTFSSDGEGSLLVRPCHAEVAVRVLREAFDGALGYDIYSNATRERLVNLDEDAVMQRIKQTRYPASLVKAMVASTSITLVDLEDWSGDEKEAVRELASFLVRSGALKRSRSAYYKSPAFISFLRRASGNGQMTELHATEQKREAEF